MINNIAGPGATALPSLSPATTAGTTTPAKGFGESLQNMLASVNEAQLGGDQAIERLQSGGVQNLHEVMIAVEEAEVSLRMLVQMRNRAVTAYEEIMRMQI
ncbi:MAG TPA: flagellar hook-basal body complex protein FliE [Desulforhopalus sp.]|nr:flagellar hook-basal body complex protein FliE [Desulforhopalus sp.]